MVRNGKVYSDWDLDYNHRSVTFGLKSISSLPTRSKPFVIKHHSFQSWKTLKGYPEIATTRPVTNYTIIPCYFSDYRHTILPFLYVFPSACLTSSITNPRIEDLADIAFNQRAARCFLLLLPTCSFSLRINTSAVSLQLVCRNVLPLVLGLQAVK